MEVRHGQRCMISGIDQDTTGVSPNLPVRSMMDVSYATHSGRLCQYQNGNYFRMRVR